METRHGVGKAKMVIPISGMDEKKYPFSFDVDAAALDLADRFRGPITADGVVSRVGHQYHVSGTIRGTNHGECDRCLIETSREIETDFEIVYTVSGEPLSEIEDLEDGSNGVVTLAPEDHQIILDEELRQALLLGVPMKNLCKEECRGLCPTCGHDLNQGECGCGNGPIDPRWSKLQGLFPDEDDSN